MPESLLQYLLGLLDVIEEPVVLASALERFSLPAALRLIEEGVLRQTSDAEEIIRPKRFGPPITVVVRKTASGIWGVPEEDEYYESVKLTDDDIRLYEIRLSGLVEKIRKENGIDGTGYQPDRGLVHVGKRLVRGHGLVAVYLSLPNINPDAVLARLKRMDAPGRGGTVALLTPTALSESTEFRRLVATDNVVPISLMQPAASGTLDLDWEQCLGQTGTAERATSVSPAKRQAQKSIGSPAAVVAIDGYMAARGLNDTQFANQFQTTDRTLRKFLKTGKMRRANFEAMAACIGVSIEELLAGNLQSADTKSSR